MTFAESQQYDPSDGTLLSRVLSHIGYWPAPTESDLEKGTFIWWPKKGIEYFATLELHEEARQITFTSFCTDFDYIKVILSTLNFQRLEENKEMLLRTLPGRYRGIYLG